MAKFKVGDKVTDGNSVYKITWIDTSWGSYEWKRVSGMSDPTHEAGCDIRMADRTFKIANSRVCNFTNAARSPLYTGKSREVIDKITQGKYIGGVIGTVYYNPNGPFKWMINSSGWVYVAQPSRLNVLGDRRFGWKVFRVEKDGMLKQTNYHDFDSIQEAQRAFDELKSINSTNPVVRKAMNSVACNSTIDDALAEAERNKYDSVVLFQKVIGRGTLFPDKFKLDGGYDCEDAVRAAVKTGKYYEAIFYKNGAIKKRIGLNYAG